MRGMVKKWRAVWVKLNAIWQGGVPRGSGAGREEWYRLDDYLEIPTYIRRGQAGVIRRGWLG